MVYNHSFIIRYILTDTDFLDENLKHEKWTEFGF